MSHVFDKTLSGFPKKKKEKNHQGGLGKKGSYVTHWIKPYVGCIYVSGTVSLRRLGQYFITTQTRDPQRSRRYFRRGRPD